MANLARTGYQHLLLVSFAALFAQTEVVVCYQYKVGDLDSWGIPTSSNPDIYVKWSKAHSFKIGDSLLFLYPPSQDSVIQVTEESYKKCNLKDPILYMNNGNSLFNITEYGEFYFTSGVAGHCDKKQKLHISVLSGNESSAANATTAALPDYAPSYPTVFGTIPVSPSSPPATVVGFAVSAILITCIM